MIIIKRVRIIWVRLSDKAVSRWETGKSFPDIEILENLATELDLNISDIIAGEITQNNNDIYNKDIIQIASEKKKNLKKLINPALLITLFISIPLIIYSYNIFYDTLNLYQKALDIKNAPLDMHKSILFFSSAVFISLIIILLLIIPVIRKLNYKPKFIEKDYKHLTYKQKFLRLIPFSIIHILILYYTLDYFIALIIKQSIPFISTNFIWCGTLLVASVISIIQTATNFIKWRYKHSD